MAITEWRCDKCRVTEEKYKPVEKTPKCIHCGDEMFKVVSVPGYRRDHTVLDNE